MTSYLIACLAVLAAIGWCATMVIAEARHGHDNRPCHDQNDDWTNDPHQYGPAFADITEMLPDVTARMALIAAGQDPDQP